MQFFQADTFRKNERISSYYTSVVHQAQTYILPCKVFLMVDWEPLPEVAGPLIITELRTALLHTRQMKYWLKMQHIKVMEDPPRDRIAPEIRILFLQLFPELRCDKKLVRYKHKADALWESLLSTDNDPYRFLLFVFIWENVSSAQEHCYCYGSCFNHKST